MSCVHNQQGPACLQTAAVAAVRARRGECRHQHRMIRGNQKHHGDYVEIIDKELPTGENYVRICVIQKYIINHCSFQWDGRPTRLGKVISKFEKS